MNPLLTTVATEVATEFGSRLSSILASTRGRPEDARARAIAMFVYDRVAPSNLPGRRTCYTAIGTIFDRDRTTVRHALTRVHSWMAHEERFAARVDEVIGRVEARQ